MKEIYPESLDTMWLKIIFEANHHATLKMSRSENFSPKFSFDNVRSATAYRGKVCSAPLIAKYGIVYDRKDHTVTESAAVNHIKFRMECTEKMVYISNAFMKENRDIEECKKKLLIASVFLIDMPYISEGDEVIVLHFEMKDSISFNTVLNVTELEFEIPE